MEKKNSRYGEITQKAAKRKENDPDSIDATEASYLFKAPSQLPDSGTGLFTAIEIYKNETIAIYKGRTVSAKRSLKLAKEGKDLYFIEKPDGTIFDSMNSECFAMYANDAEAYPDSPFKNNAEIRMDENDDVCLMALRNIKAHEEIFCGYGKRYWKKHSAIPVKGKN